MSRFNNPNEPVERATWEEFRSNGMLWFINQILHLFGFAIAVKIDDDGKITEAYPIRTAYRGFGDQSQSRGYYNLTKYLAENAAELLEDCEAPEE